MTEPNPSLAAIERRFRELCARIDPSLSGVALVRTAQHDGSSHVEIDEQGMHLVTTERGIELDRRTTKDDCELLYWLVSDVAWGRASVYELNHRMPGQSFRRLLFAKTLEYLEAVDPAWAAAKRDEFAQILDAHPYDDAAEG